MISIIGSGNVGVSLASLIANKGLDDITLIDIVPGLAKGEALDISQADLPGDLKISGSDNMKDIEGSGIVVITSGSGRKPGMSRLDLVEKNTGIIKENISRIKKYAKESIVIVVTNPVDVMTYLALKTSGFPKERVFGMGSLLDSFRFSHFLSEEFGVSRGSVNALVIGEHGDQMVPLKTHSFINGRPLAELGEEEKINNVIEKTILGAEEIVKMKGHTRHAPASAILRMIESILNDKKDRLPLQAYLEGEYNQENVCIGVPAVLGRNGIEKITELGISEYEKTMFSLGVEKIKKICEQIKFVIE